MRVRVSGPLCFSLALLFGGLTGRPAAAMPLVSDTVPGTPVSGDVGTALARPPDTLPLVALPALEIQVLRTPTPRNQAPLSISALGPRELTAGRSGTSLEEALQALPGVQIQNRYNYSTGERIILRGQGGRTQFGVRGLRILVDGVPATLPDGQATLDHLDFLSLGRVEILRGPASALYGNGAGGVLRFTSLPSPPVRLQTDALLTVGSDGLRRTGAMVSGALEDIRYRLSAGHLGWDGFRTDPTAPGGRYGGVQRWNAHGTLQLPLAGGRLDLTLSLLDQDSENPGSLSRSLLAEDPKQAYAFNVTQKTGEEARQALAGFTWHQALGGMTLEMGGHGIHRDLWNPIPPAVIDLAREAGGFRTQLRGEGTRGPLQLQWVAGGEMEGQWDTRKNFANQEGTAGETTLDQEESVRGLGGFIQGQLAYGDLLHILVGLRLDQIRFDAEDRLVTETNPDDSGSRTMGAMSPSLGARVFLGRGFSLRSSVSTFFQTPTTSELANRSDGAGGINPDLDPQRGYTLEAGLEGRWEDRLHLEAIFFQTRIRDQLIPFQVPSAPGRSFFRNAGTSNVDGVELSGFGLVGGGLSLRGAYTYTRARFDDFTLDGTAMDGNQIPGLAPHRMEGVIRWDSQARGDRHRGFLETRLLYNGEIPVDDINSDATSPYGLVDLRLGVEGWELLGREFSVFSGITNMLNRSYSTAVSVNAFGGRYFEPGPGRSVYLGLRALLSS